MLKLDISGRNRGREIHMRGRIKGDDPEFARTLQKGRVYKLSSPVLSFIWVLILFPAMNDSLTAFFTLIGICGIAACLVSLYGPRAVVNHTDLWLKTWFGPPARVLWTEVTAATWECNHYRARVSRVELQVSGRPLPLIVGPSWREANMRSLFKEIVRNAKLCKTGEQLRSSGLLRLNTREHEYWARAAARANHAGNGGPRR